MAKCSLLCILTNPATRPLGPSLRHHSRQPHSSLLPSSHIVIFTPSSFEISTHRIETHVPFRPFSQVLGASTTAGRVDSTRRWAQSESQVIPLREYSSARATGSFSTNDRCHAQPPSVPKSPSVPIIHTPLPKAHP